MILSCKRIRKRVSPDMSPQWLVATTPHVTAEEIMNRCEVIPKLGGDHPDKPSADKDFQKWTCSEVTITPKADGVDDVFLITAKFCEKPQEVVAPEDEPQFPPYTRPVGKQPDGSCILSPRAWAKLSEAMRWLGWQEHRGHPSSRAAGDHLQEFADIYSQDTGLDLDTYT